MIEDVLSIYEDLKSVKSRATKIQRLRDLTLNPVWSKFIVAVYDKNTTVSDKESDFNILFDFNTFLDCVQCGSPCINNIHPKYNVLVDCIRKNTLGIRLNEKYFIDFYVNKSSSLDNVFEVNVVNHNDVEITPFIKLDLNTIDQFYEMMLLNGENRLNMKVERNDGVFKILSSNVSKDVLDTILFEMYTYNNTFQNRVIFS